MHLPQQFDAIVISHRRGRKQGQHVERGLGHRAGTAQDIHRDREVHRPARRAKGALERRDQFGFELIRVRNQGVEARDEVKHANGVDAGIARFLHRAFAESGQSGLSGNNQHRDIVVVRASCGGDQIGGAGA